MINPVTLLYYLLGIILVYIFIRILFVPIKLLFKLLINACLGGAALWIFNIFGGDIGINPVTVLTVAILGIPGFVLLLILQYIG